MASQEDSEFFSDDHLDNLNPEVLDGLENQAIQFTQQQQPVQYESSDYGDDIDDEDLEDVEIVDEGRTGGTQAWAVPIVPNAPSTIQQQPRYVANNTISRPIQPVQSQFAQPISQRAPPVYSQRPIVNASRNIPPARPPIPPSTSTQREQFRQQRYGNDVRTPVVDRSRSQSTQQPPPSTTHARAGADRIAQGSAQTPAAVEALQRQLDELMKERDALKQDVNVKAGEIAIVRSKQEKAAKEHERELAAIRKLSADELAKQKRAIEQAKDAEKKAATELAFTKRDMAEEAERLKNLKKATGSKLNKVPATPTKKLAHRDGFDDDDVQIISPSKFKGRISNPATPTKAGGKRKRKATGVESPIGELEVHVDEAAVVEDEKRPSVIIGADVIERLGRQDDRLDFLQNMLNHRPFRGHVQTFEAFANHFLPSSPRESLSSILLGQLPLLSSKKSPEEFPVDFCELILSLWARCLKEKYNKPIYLFIDLVTHALNLKTLAIAPHILDSLLPLTQSTGDLVAIPRFKRETIPPGFEQDISITSCLSLLYLTAMGCVSRIEYLIRFWKLVRLDFVLMLLSLDQLPSDFILVLQLLRMSVLPENTSIGPISPDQEMQSRDTGYMIVLMTSPLADPPLSAPKKETKLDPATLSQLRLEILRTTDAISRIKTGGKALAKHPHAIGRLVSIISSEMDLLYDYHGGSRHSVSSEIVTLATKLLHFLVINFEGEVGRLQEKLAVVHGGVHRHLVSLARLALRDEEAAERGELVLEGGVGGRVGEWAKELLEMACTMEEADAIHEALVGDD